MQSHTIQVGLGDTVRVHALVVVDGASYIENSPKPRNVGLRASRVRHDGAYFFVHNL